MRITLADLEQLLPNERVYPSGVVHPIRPRLLGRSFFPGGCGLAFGGDQHYPDRPIMLVGQDFDSANDWLQLDDQALQQAERISPTWRRLDDLHSQGMLDLRRVFVTNALLGARIAKSNTGRSPAWSFEQYVRASFECLERQITLLGPTVVVSLGVEATVLLSRAFGLVPPDWDVVAQNQWQQIDGRGLQFVRAIERHDVSFAFASCVHPSYQHLNAKRRTWNRCDGKLFGDAAHREIWRAVREHDQALNQANQVP